MKVSFNGIGEKPVTFISGGAKAGQVVKVSGAGTVAPCGEGDGFDGLALFVEEGCACVRLSGFVSAAYSGTVPGYGRVGLSADGSGGVKADESGREYLVVDTDSTAGTVTFCL